MHGSEKSLFSKNYAIVYIQIVSFSTEIQKFSFISPTIHKKDKRTKRKLEKQTKANQKKLKKKN
jgi:hypothetical protein